MSSDLQQPLSAPPKVFTGNPIHIDPNLSQKDSRLVRFCKDFTAGWLGGMAQVLVGQPFDTIKVRIQTQDLYAGPLDCLLKTIKNEGVSTLYKGTFLPLLGIGFSVSIQFAALEQMKRFFGKTLNAQGSKKNFEFTPGQLLIAGSVAGLANTTVAGPIEHIRIRLQASKDVFSGPFHCISKIYRSSGIRGIFQGHTMIMIRDGLGFGAYFLVYEALVQKAIRHKIATGSENCTRDSLEAWKLVLFGGAAGAAFWSMVFPVDVIKSKIQTDSYIAKERKYPQIAGCIRSVWMSEGIPGFFKGFIPCFLRSAPVNAATFMAFEMAMRALG